MSKSNGPTLTDRKRSGGIIAQDGFDYQVWSGLTRLPKWLTFDAFEGIIFEGFEDFEGRFFAPHAPHRHFLDRFQAKSGNLSPGDVREVMEEFRRFDVAHPSIVRVQTLITPALPSGMGWLQRDLGRVRNARPFYAPFAQLQEASDRKLFQDLTDEFGEDLANSVFQSVEVEGTPAMSRGTAQAFFAAAMNEVFQDVSFNSRKVGEAFSALVDLAGTRRGQMLPRSELLTVLSEKLEATFVGRGTLRLHVRSDRNEAAEGPLEINAAGFSGTNGFPPPNDWSSGLTLPLQLSGTWARQLGYQRIQLSGSYRLSTGMAVGWALRSATGFEIEIQTRTGAWATDDRPPVSMTLPWQFSEARELVEDCLIFTVGIIRDPAPDVAASRALAADRNMLTAVLPQAITTGAELQRAVSEVKARVTANAAALRAKRIDLYLAGPAAFAVALGHRWNALPPTQLHEYIAAERRYVPTASIG